MDIIISIREKKSDGTHAKLGQIAPFGSPNILF